MVPFFYCSPGILHKHFWLWISSFQSPQAASSDPAALLSLGLLSSLHVPAPSRSQSLCVPADTCPGLGRRGMWSRPSVLPATDQLFQSPLTAPGSPPAQLVSLLLRDSFGCGNLSVSLGPLKPQGHGSHPTSSPFFPLSSFFCSTWSSKIFFVLSSV